MKVALLIPTLRVGGAERNILRIGRELRAAGTDVEVWLTSADERELDTDLPVVALGAARRGGRGAAIIGRARAIARQIDRSRPDCMISFLESSSIPGTIASRMRRTPIIVSVRGNPQRFNWLYRAAALLLYRFAHRVVTPSAEAGAYLARRFFLGNTACIPNITSTGELSERTAADAKRSGPAVAVGRLVPGKRFDDVLALAESGALSRAIVIIGEGPEGDALRSRAAARGLPVRFTGALPQRQVLDMISRASVLVSMSESECWPNVVTEALALGTPVVARDCDYGPREMITDGSNGFLVDTPDDVVKREEIRAALSDPERYAALCRSAEASAAAWGEDRVRSLWLALLSTATA